MIGVATTLKADSRRSRVIVLTGASSGLGLEAARRLAAAGHQVWAAARTEGDGSIHETGARFIRMDVTDERSVQAAVDVIAAGARAIDVLVNNAGVAGCPNQAPVIEFERVYATNVFGVIRVTHAFLPLLRLMPGSQVINVSSHSGSFAMVTNPADPRYHGAQLAYASTKAALNMLTVQWAKDVPEVSFDVIAPGFSKTALNGYAGFQTVSEGTDALFDLISDGHVSPEARFSDRLGRVGW